VTLFFRACDPVQSPAHHDPSFGLCFFRLPPIEAALRPACAGILASARSPRFGGVIGRRDSELVRALRAMAEGCEYDAARVREIGAAYFAARSGVFAEAKRATMTALCSSPLDARVAAVSSFLGVAAVRVPNYAAFEALDLKGMAGDDEMARIKRGVEEGAWCGCPTRGYARMSVPADDTWRGVLLRAGIGVRSVHERAEDAPVDLVPVDPARVAVERAIAEVSAASLDEISARGNLPAVPIARMFAALGLDAADARAVVRVHLREWRDVNAADMYAADLLARASAGSC
jgi:hypothetical protein